MANGWMDMKDAPPGHYDAMGVWHDTEYVYVQVIIDGKKNEIELTPEEARGLALMILAKAQHVEERLCREVDWNG